MSLNNPKRIEEYILKHLRKGPMLMIDLVETLKKDRKNTTKQAVYAALRLLKKEEQIVTYKGVASLNLTWLNSMINYFYLAKVNYIKGDFNDSFINLEDKEKIKYYFQNPIKTDIFWTHALYLLFENNEVGEPLYIYNPHEWFLLARKENEEKLFKVGVQKGHRLLLTVGNDCFLDKYVKKYFDNESSQYHFREKPLFEENNYYINIIGDFLIEVWLNKKLADRIDKFYKEIVEWNDENLKKLEEIVSKEGKTKIVISRNKNKADKIKRMLSKNFVLK